MLGSRLFIRGLLELLIRLISQSSSVSILEILLALPVSTFRIFYRYDIHNIVHLFLARYYIVTKK